MGADEGGLGKGRVTYQAFAIMSLPSGFSAFLRRFGMVTLARDERRLRFCSSRPIVCDVDGELVRVGVGDSNLPSPR